MRSSCSIRRTAAAGSLPVISGQSLGRLISPWSASAAIHTSWHYGRPTVERCRHRCSTETPLPINLSIFAERTEIVAHALADRLQRLEVRGAACRVDADAFGRAVIHRDEHRDLAL